MPLNLEPAALIRDRTYPPLYAQLAVEIRQAIATGALQPDEPLPASAKLQEMVEVSDAVVRQALDLLADDGLIVRRSGAAPLVAKPPEVRHIDSSRHRRVLQQLANGEIPETSFVVDHGCEWEDYSIDADYTREKATAEDARRLDIKLGSPILRRVLIKNLRGEPRQVQRSAIPYHLAKGTALEDPSRQPVHGGTLAELWEAGIVPTGLVEEIEPTRPPNHVERRQLKLRTSAHVASIVRVLEVEGRPVEVSRSITPAGRYVLRYETDLRIGGRI